METVTVRFFASLREQRGREVEELPHTAGMTLSSLYDSLFPPHADRVPVGFALNQCIVPGETPVEAGDEVVFIPPVGGG